MAKVRFFNYIMYLDWQFHELYCTAQPQYRFSGRSLQVINTGYNYVRKTITNQMFEVFQ